jgi:hypothetical protein
VSKSHSARHKELTILGIVLCLLAALFAIESKLAWYGPDGSPTAQVSASKLQAAEAPRLVAQALASTLPIPHFPETAQILALILAAGAARSAPLPEKAQPARLISSSLSPHLFFRPPPAR